MRSGGSGQGWPPNAVAGLKRDSLVRKKFLWWKRVLGRAAWWQVVGAHVSQIESSWGSFSSSMPPSLIFKFWHFISSIVRFNGFLLRLVWSSPVHTTIVFSSRFDLFLDFFFPSCGSVLRLIFFYLGSSLVFHVYLLDFSGFRISSRVSALIFLLQYLCLPFPTYCLVTQFLVL